MFETTGFYSLLVPAALVAGCVRGFAGFGGVLVLLPALNIYLVPAVSIPVIMWIDLLVNIRLLPEAYRDASSPVVAPLTVGTVVAMPLGVYALVALDPSLMKRCVSSAILIAALILLSGWRYHGAIGRMGWVAVGALTGAIMGATSLAVSAALFLHADKQTAAESRANFIVWVFLATVALLAMLAVGTGLDGAFVPVILILAPLYVIGSVIGSHMNKNLPEAMVRRAVLLLVVAVAVVGLVA